MRKSILSSLPSLAPLSFFFVNEFNEDIFRLWVGKQEHGTETRILGRKRSGNGVADRDRRARPPHPPSPFGVIAVLSETCR